MNAEVEEHDRHVDAWLQKIDALFQGQLDGRSANEVYGHVKTCERCERTFNRYAFAEKGLFGKRENAISPFAAERIGSRLFAESKRLRASKGILGMALATALSITIAAVLILPREQGGEFRARSSAAAKSGDASIRALVITVKENGDLDVRDLASAETKARPGDRIKLLYSNFGSYLYASAAIVDGTGRTIGLIAPGLIDKNVEDVDIGSAIALPDDLASGALRIVTVFSSIAIVASPSMTAGPADGRMVRVIDAHVAREVEP